MAPAARHQNYPWAEHRTAPDYPELVWAAEHKVPVVSFAEFAGEIMAHEERLVVAGTHGKTTTTSMIAWILDSAGRRPDFLIGIQPLNFNSSVRLEGGKVAVIEGDEYTASQLDRRPKFDYYHPDRLILTSLEMDHPDVFKDLADIVTHFRRLVGGLQPGSYLYKWVGSKELQHLVAPVGVKVQTYGIQAGDWLAQKVNYGQTGLSYDLVHGAENYGRLNVPLFGAHNVANSVAASSLLLDFGLTFKEIQAGFSSFLGAARRFQLISEPPASIRVIDDYAHHPTEVAATIAAAKQHFDGRVIVAFRPHTFSRTVALLEEYRRAFALADVAFITDIEGAREKAQAAAVSGDDIVQGGEGNLFYEPGRDKLIERLAAEARPGDTILCMTVSGYDHLAESVASRLKLMV